MSGLVQVRGDAPETACPHCGASVGPDQRYCLSCGKPCAPLRLPFLDVLQNGSGQRALGPSGGLQSGYVPPLRDDAHGGPLQRYSGLFALLGVLLLAGTIGLLIGHWAAGSSGPGGPQVVKIEGLGGLTPSAVSAATSSSTTTSSTASAAKEIEHESKQEEKETAASNLAKPTKHTAGAVKRLSKLTGKRYEQEINKIANGPAPIETGG